MEFTGLVQVQLTPQWRTLRRHRNRRPERPIGSPEAMAAELAYDAICALCQDEQIPDRSLLPQARTLLGDILISRSDPCPENALLTVDAILTAEASSGRVVLTPSPEGMPMAKWFSLGTVGLAVYRGDICNLAVGAVVNAANDQGLGCFQPRHKCIDNVLHRAAGPRLREECRHLMAQRGTPLSAGSAPLLTSGYHLPAAHILHVTGPMLQPRGRQPTAAEESTLTACYTGCLEAAAAAGIRSVAFCCISTGLFGYPSAAAAIVAVATVSRWLLAEPSRQAHFDAIIFDVFTEDDQAAYLTNAPRILASLQAAHGVTHADLDIGDHAESSPQPLNSETAPQRPIPIVSDLMSTDRLLIVAAAGLSISLDAPNNPYHSASDFARHYPTVASHGYRTAYHAMGLGGDRSVPAPVRVAYLARHFLNMRCHFPPTDGYEHLRRLAATYPPEDVFVWTSNVDGCFERSGFDSSRIYQTQGEMSRLQCARPGCGNVWGCLDQMRAVDAATTDGALTNMDLVPACPKCGSAWPDIRPNLRGGDWFIHKPYDAASKSLMTWLDDCVEKKANVAIVEVGVGPNTPIVTRIPACAFASAVRANGGHPVYVRINPDPPEGPRENPDDDVTFHRIQQTWEALEPLVEAVVTNRAAGGSGSGSDEAAAAEAAPVETDPHVAAMWQRRYHEILLSLRREPSE